MKNFPVILKQILRILTNGSFRRKKNAATLTDEQYRAISIGAVLSEQGSFYINTLETGVDKMVETKKLIDWWDVHNPTSAMAVLNYLKNTGHRGDYAKIVNILKKDDPKDWENRVGEGMFDQAENALYFLYNLSDSMTVLQEDDAIKDLNELDVDITAWDMGRMVSLARSFYTLNYISEKVAWDHMIYALKVSQQIYDHWGDFAKAYVIGRAMWSGNNDIYYSVRKLLEDKKSPWNEVSFK